MRNRKSFLGMKFDARAIFALAALIGAGSLFVTTLTSEAPETFAEEAAPAATHEIPEAKAETPKSEVPADAKAVAKKGGCLTDEASIADVQELKKELAKREADLKRREDEVAAKEAAVAEELKKLDVVRDEIKSAQALGDAKSEEKVGKLVETFESMSPKAAAAIVASVDERLAVEAMARLSSAKLGKILAAMEPAKSVPLAEKLAGVVRAKRNTASIGAAETTNRVKGGEENGNLKQSSTDAVVSRQPEPALGREPAGAEKR